MSYKDILYPVKDVIKTYEFISFDVETTGKDKEFYLCGIRDKHGYKYFYDKKDAIKYLLDDKNKGIRIATNLYFDYAQLFKNTKEFYDLKPTFAGGRIIRLKYIDSRGRIINFYDTLNYLPFGVEGLGGLLKLPKLPHPKNIISDDKYMPNGQLIKNSVWIKPRTEEEEKILLEYNKRDCEITYRASLEIIQQGLNEVNASMKCTISSSALNGKWRKRLVEPLAKEKLVYPEFNKYAFLSYFGGRSEVLTRGLIKNIKIFDCNSMYPSVMLKEYPNPNSVRKVITPDSRTLEYDGITKARIEAPDNDIQLLPYRLNKKLIFPKGKFLSWYTNAELIKAKEQGYIVKPVTSYIYPRTWFPFKDYVEEIYEKRKQYIKENNPLEKMMKSLLNNLYGKFAEHKHGDYELSQAEDGVQYDGERFGDVVVWSKERVCNSPHVFPILSSYTTAYARLKLFEHIKKYDSVYSDTDSLFTQKEIPQSNKLGEFKLVNELKSVIIVRPKHYLEEGIGFTHVKMKGVKGANKDIFNRVLRGEDIYMTRFAKLKESIKRGLATNTDLIIKKKLGLNDNKRIWHQKFNPYIADDDSEPIEL
jgi:hypothetical protein